jgi:hypothetical protein
MRRNPGRPILAASILAILLSTIVATPFLAEFALPWQDVPMLAAFGIVKSALGTHFFLIGAKHLPAVQRALITAMETPLALFGSGWPLAWQPAFRPVSARPSLSARSSALHFTTVIQQANDPEPVRAKPAIRLDRKASPLIGAGDKPGSGPYTRRKIRSRRRINDQICLGPSGPRRPL